MKIFILGANGFVGSNIINYLKNDYDITPITRSNYHEHQGHTADIFINSNGNSRRFWANQNPILDFEASVTSVQKTIFDFKFKKYIYLSSLSAYENSHYGINKTISEGILQQYANKMDFDITTLRMGSVIGPNMIKGPLFDIIRGNKLFVTPDSTFQFITTEEIAKFIKFIITTNIINISNLSLNIAGTTSITIAHAANILNKNMTFNDVLEKQSYSYSVADSAALYPLKTSEEYVNSII